MDREGFGRHVDVFFAEQPCEDIAGAKEALLWLYDYLSSCAAEAEQLTVNSMPWNGLLFRILHTMIWSPLRLFWCLLAKDESLILRACAKFNIAETTGEYFDDPEIELITQATDAVMSTFYLLVRLQDETTQAQPFQEADKLWSKSTYGTRFTSMSKAQIFGNGQSASV